MKLNLPRGMRDMPPEQQIARNEIVRTLQNIFARYGFAPLETPVLERFDVLSSKYAGGAEILKETFQLKDQKGRKLALRYDLTVPLARFIAMNPNIKLPFKRYQIERVYRDGPIKLGRYREFYQCDCDIVGADTPLADAQCLQVGLTTFTELNIPVALFVNDIAILRELLEKGGVPKKQLTEAMLILDKLKKIGEEGVRKELKKASIPPRCVDEVLRIAALPTNEEKLAACNATRLSETLELVPDERIVFDPSMSRGLAYYTGIVFEAFPEDSEVNVSLCGGGRYNTMIGEFLGKPEKYPAVGISFGLEPILDVAQLPARKTLTQVFVIPIKVQQEASALAETLRDTGIATDIDLLGRGVSKNLDYANQQGIPFVIIIGKKELDAGTCTVKEMASGHEEQMRLDAVATAMKERL